MCSFHARQTNNAEKYKVILAPKKSERVPEFYWIAILFKSLSERQIS
jgi:hypothetical protein